MSVGIGITTRNRPECLEACLRHFKEFGYGDKIVVVDDNSDAGEVNSAIVKSFEIPVIYKYSEKRLGIASAKNACLWELSDMDHVFLFDDDSWPAMHGWEKRWISINKFNNIGHSIYGVDCQSSEYINAALRAHVEETGRIGDFNNQMIAYNNCFGVVLYFSRECLNAIGGYDGSAENVYGYEHAQISMRAASAGFTQGHKYISPAASMEMIYSIDIAHNWLNATPPLSVSWLNNSRSSVSKEEADGHTNNAKLMDTANVYIQLVNPLE
jgi:glycosyltransferase involved in cell wall biosynthesis